MGTWTPEKLRLGDQPGDICRWWTSRPPRHDKSLTREEQEQAMAAAHDHLVAAVDERPEDFWAAFWETVPAAPDPGCALMAWAVLPAIFGAAPYLEERARDQAAGDPIVLHLLFEAYLAMVPEGSGTFPQRDAWALKRLPRESMIEAFVRRNSSDDLADVDLWTVGLIGYAAEVDPDYAWEVVLELVRRVPDDQLTQLGASDLEDFCSAACSTHLERIEQEAQRDPRFRQALFNVWKKFMPDDQYARIRAAAGDALEPPSSLNHSEDGG